jgi:hypothetical protein
MHSHDTKIFLESLKTYCLVTASKLMLRVINSIMLMNEYLVNKNQTSTLIFDKSIFATDICQINPLNSLIVIFMKYIMYSKFILKSREPKIIFYTTYLYILIL